MNEIDLVRSQMKNMFIDPKCDYLIKCFINYTKEFDEKRQVWKNNPLHDVYSHGADAIRYMVRGYLKHNKPITSNYTKGLYK